MSADNIKQRPIDQDVSPVIESTPSPLRQSLTAIVKYQEALAHEPWKVVSEMRQALEAEGIPTVERVGKSPLPTDFGDWSYLTYHDYTAGTHHDVLVFGDMDAGSLGDGENVLVRFHSACRTNEAFHAINCECRAELHEAMKAMQQEGRGIIVYLDQEGRGTGMAGKHAQLGNMFEWVDGKIQQQRDQETGELVNTVDGYEKAGYPSEVRDFRVGVQMLQDLGIKSVRLITNNPGKVAPLTEAGIPATPVEIHIDPPNEVVATDLRAKAERHGHNIKPDHWTYNGRREN